MAKTKPVVVVGGGVIGLCAAWSLRRRGADVVILEANTIGSGSSHGNGGWICPSLSGPLPGPGQVRTAMRSMFRPESPLYLKPRVSSDLARWLFAFWRRCNTRDYLAGVRAQAALGAPTMELFDALVADGVKVDVHATGLLNVCKTVEYARANLEALRPLEEFGYELPSDVLSGDELQALEPALSPKTGSGFLIREERYLDPARFMVALRNRVRVMGVEVHEQATVRALVPSSDGWTIGTSTGPEEASSGRVEASSVLLAAGSWTPALAKMLRVRIPMQAGKGYSFSIVPDVMPVHPILVTDAKIGLTPLGDRLRVAGTMELSGVNTRLDRRRIDAMILAVRPYLASWPGTIKDEWTGMRPVPSDGNPIIGPLGPDGLYISTGHGMLGLTLAPASGEAIAEMMLERTPDVLKPFGLDRF